MTPTPAVAPKRTHNRGRVSLQASTAQGHLAQMKLLSWAGRRDDGEFQRASRCLGRERLRGAPGCAGREGRPKARWPLGNDVTPPQTARTRHADVHVLESDETVLLLGGCAQASSEVEVAHVWVI